MKKNVIILFLLTTTSLFIGCTDGNPSSKEKEAKEEKCKYGTPTPIFSSDLKKITFHEFTAEGQKGVEKVIFENDVELELLQSGCNEILQSFQFTVKVPDTHENKFWIGLAIEQFNYLSTLSDDHVSFGFWAKAIINNLDIIKIGEPFEPEPNTFIKIDKIPSGEKTILVVTFEGKG